MSDEIIALREEVARLRGEMDALRRRFAADELADDEVAASSSPAPVPGSMVQLVQLGRQPGELQIQIASGEHGPGIYLYDLQGKCRMLLEVGERGPRFELFGDENKSIVTLKSIDGHGQVCVAAPDGSPREPAAPCSGALCSGNPAPLPSTLPSVLPTGAGQWASPAFLISLATPGSLACPSADADLHPVDRSCSIFHPPRFLASLITA
jgi:hypothetical protein